MMGNPLFEEFAEDATSEFEITFADETRPDETIEAIAAGTEGGFVTLYDMDGVIVSYNGDLVEEVHRMS